MHPLTFFPFVLHLLTLSFLGPRGPLRTPLVPVVVRCPQQKFTQPLIISFPFLSDSKLKQPLPQYTVHRTLNRINSRTFLAQFGLVSFFYYYSLFSVQIGAQSRQKHPMKPYLMNHRLTTIIYFGTDNTKSADILPVLDYI